MKNKKLEIKYTKKNKESISEVMVCASWKRRAVLMLVCLTGGNIYWFGNRLGRVRTLSCGGNQMVDPWKKLKILF